MNLTPQTQHALMSMLILTRHEDDTASAADPSYISLSSLSNRIRISVSYLEQLFKLLRQAELVVSMRGPNGGYRLARPAERITLGAVARAVNPGRRAYLDETHQHLLDRLNVHIDHFLGNLTLRDVLVVPEHRDADPLDRSEQAA